MHRRKDCNGVSRSWEEKMNDRILIVDDNWDEGTAIKRALINAGFKADFFFYDSARIESLPDAGGIRIVFCDLNLTGEGIGGHKDYATVAAILQRVIPQTNGPYALVSWTTFDEAAKDLRDYLVARTPQHCHPMEFSVIAKEGLLIPTAINDLKNAVLDVFKNFPAIAAILEWEAASIRAISTVVSQLEKVTSKEGNETFDKRLHQVLTKLAEAEGGEHAIDKDNIADPFMNVLGRLLHDEMSKISIASLRAHTDQNLAAFNEQKAEFNSMLHINATPPSSGKIGSLPGLIFNWPIADGEAYRAGIGIPTIADRMLFISKAFLKQPLPHDQASKVSLVIFDATPSCDHSQNKVPWRRFIGGLLVAKEHATLVHPSAKTGDGSNLRRMPEFRLGETAYLLVLNSHLTFSITNNLATLKLLGDPRFQIREQLMSDVLGWAGRQASRLGYTFFE
jgi:hypothetical protein